MSRMPLNFRAVSRWNQPPSSGPFHIGQDSELNPRCIPGTMNALVKNSKFGLASDDEQGRAEAVSMHKLANHMLHKMNDRYGGR